MICRILALASVSSSCAVDATLFASLAEMDDRLVIENTGTACYVALVTSFGGEQRREIAVGKEVSASNASQQLKLRGLVESTTELRKDQIFWRTTQSISY